MIRRSLTRLLPVAALGASLLGATVVLSVPALAHSELVESSPADGAVLSKPPTEVQLTFGEDVQSQGGGIVVKSPADQRVDSPGTFAVDSNLASVDLVPSASDDEVYVDGQYTVSYRIVSADGHIVSGAYDFRLRGETPSESAAPALSSTLDSSPAADSSEPADSNGTVIWVLGLGAIGIVLVAAVISVALRGRRGR